MAGLADLLQAITGQTQQMNAAPPAAWQQSLTQAVDPAKMKREAIAKALATAGRAMATTPGNFLTGLSAGITGGADQYLAQRDANEQRRLAAQMEIDKAQRGDQEARWRLITDLFGITRGVENDEYGRSRDRLGDARTAENDKYNRSRDKVGDARYEDEQNWNRGRQKRLDDLASERVEIARERAKIDAERVGLKSGSLAGKPLSEWQQAQVRRDIEREVADFMDNLPTTYTEEDRQANEKAIAEYRTRMYQIQNFDPSTGQYLGGQGSASTTGGAPPSSNRNDWPAGATDSREIDGKRAFKIGNEWFFAE